METTIIGTKKVKYIVGYDKGEWLKMSRKVLKKLDCLLSHILQFEAAPNSAEAAPLFSPTAPLPLLMTGPLFCFTWNEKLMIRYER
jgi:hypothetical protein